MANDVIADVEKQEQRRLASIKSLSESFMVEKALIAAFFENGLDYMEIKKMLLCSYISKKPVNEIADLRKKFGWGRTMYLIGLTPESYATGEINYKADRINRLFGIDRDLMMKYLRLGFGSHQIKRAYYISTHCDKPIMEILEMKTRDQKWPDIAEKLGLEREACFYPKQ